ncbi:MAG: transposase [Lentisphaeria bacterium]|nr:transposase [Lentisphaeria bacterium]
MRLPRSRIRNCCVHITHRCHERRFLLGTDIDRKQYVKRLWQASRRQRALRFLDYVVTSNHIHLLVWAPRTEDLSETMHWLQGTFAGD